MCHQLNFLVVVVILIALHAPGRAQESGVDLDDPKSPDVKTRLNDVKKHKLLLDSTEKEAIALHSLEFLYDMAKYDHELRKYLCKRGIDYNFPKCRKFASYELRSYYTKLEKYEDILLLTAETLNDDSTAVRVHAIESVAYMAICENPLKPKLQDQLIDLICSKAFRGEKQEVETAIRVLEWSFRPANYAKMPKDDDDHVHVMPSITVFKSLQYAEKQLIGSNIHPDLLKRLQVLMKELKPAVDDQSIKIRNHDDPFDFGK